MTQIAGRTYWILGASQGIGHALAKALHARGAQLVLSARDKPALQQIAYDLGNGCRIWPLDVTDQQALTQACTELLQGEQPVDSVIFMAALYQPMALDQLAHDQVEQMLRVNLGAAFDLVAQAFPLLKARGNGQVVLCASLSAYRGLPLAQPYAATKAAMVSLAESLYLEARGTGVDVRVVNPGFVRTRLTAKNPFAMPALIEPDEAARRIVEGLAGRRFEIRFPRRLALGMQLLALLPYPLYFLLVRKLLVKRG